MIWYLLRMWINASRNNELVGTIHDTRNVRGGYRQVCTHCCNLVSRNQNISDKFLIRVDDSSALQENVRRHDDMRQCRGGLSWQLSSLVPFLVDRLYKNKIKDDSLYETEGEAKERYGMVLLCSRTLFEIILVKTQKILLLMMRTYQSQYAYG